MGREYATYLQDCIEYGGDPMTYDEFVQEMKEDNNGLEEDKRRIRSAV